MSLPGLLGFCLPDHFNLLRFIRLFCEPVIYRYLFFVVLFLGQTSFVQIELSNLSIDTIPVVKHSYNMLTKLNWLGNIEGNQWQYVALI